VLYVKDYVLTHRTYSIKRKPILYPTLLTIN